MTLREVLRDRALRRYANSKDPVARELAANLAAGAIVTVSYDQLKSALWEQRPPNGITAQDLHEMRKQHAGKWVVLENGDYEPVQ